MKYEYKQFRSGFKERVQMVVDTTMKTGFFKNPETVAFACEAIRSKFLMADKYVFVCSPLIRIQCGKIGTNQNTCSKAIFIWFGRNKELLEKKMLVQIMELERYQLLFCNLKLCQSKYWKILSRLSRYPTFRVFMWWVETTIQLSRARSTKPQQI